MQQIDYDTAVNLMMFAGREDILVAMPQQAAKLYPPEIRKLGNEGAVFFLPEDQPAPMTAQSSCQKKAAPKKTVDAGKIMALHKAGRSVAWIADDMGVSQQTVYVHLKKMKEMEEQRNEKYK